jgi:hypothetical protein
VVAVDETGIRSLLKPEWIILLCAVLVTFGLIWRSSSGECHHWKERLGRVTGGYLATAGEEEYPQPGLRTDTESRTDLRRAAEKLLDDRPVGCF